MGKYSGILLCSDLDGTLLNARGEVSQENAEAIRRFRREGGIFCLSTGRLPLYLTQYGDKIDLDGLVICCNGTCIYDFAAGKMVHMHPMGTKIGELAACIEAHSDHIDGLTMFTGLESVTFEGVARHAAQIRDTAQRPVYKIVLRMDREEQALALKQILAAQFGAYFNFSRSWNTGLEMVDLEATKGHAIERLRRLVGGVQTVIAVGDYENDITMLQAADIGCAVENAVDDLKAVADRIICSNNEHAMQYIVDHICDGL